jgi:hypothetical protein
MADVSAEERLAERSVQNRRPSSGEFSPSHAPYVALLPDGDIQSFLASQLPRVADFFGGMTEKRGAYRYAPDKWSVKEVLGHVCDTERIMSYRALRFARGDDTPLAGFDENLYAPAAGAGARTIADLADEFSAIRGATLALFRGLPAGAWLREGSANGAPASVRGLAWVIAGHVEHHLAIIRERYLS